MAREFRTSFAHERRVDLPDHPGAFDDDTGRSCAAFDQARTDHAEQPARPASVAETSMAEPEPVHALLEPRPSFAGPALDERLRAVAPDTSVTQAPEEMKAAFVKARLGQAALKVSRNRGR